MAHYTLTLQQIMNNVEIFDFDYPFFDEEYRKKFENDFIDYFIVEEIAHETIGLFKLRLKSKLNLIMPTYNKLYETQFIEQRILDNYDITEEYTRKIKGDSSKELIGDRTNTNNSVSKNMYKDAPKTKVDINKFDVLTNLTKIESENKDTNKLVDNENSNTNNEEKFIRTMKGNIGVQTDADAIKKYWESLRNVTREIFENELSELFMGIF